VDFDSTYECDDRGNRLAKNALRANLRTTYAITAGSNRLTSHTAVDRATGHGDVAVLGLYHGVRMMAEVRRDIALSAVGTRVIGICHVASAGMQSASSSAVQ